MAWENIEERLKKALNVKITFPSGTVWLPDAHLTIDDWLTSLAQTDEELRELNISRIRFLQDRWRVEKLVQITWERPSDRRSIWATYVGGQAYVLFFDGLEYHVIAAIAPINQPTLFRAVIGKLLENPNFVPGRAKSIKSHRPDLVSVKDAVRSAGPVDWMQPASKANQTNRAKRWKRFLSEIFVGWIGKWLNLLEMGFWHAEMPESNT